MRRRDGLFLLAAVALVCLVLSEAVHPAIAPICLMWLIVQRAMIERTRVQLPDVAMALLHMWLGVVFLGFAFLGDRGKGTMDMLELLLAFGAPFLLLKLVAPPARFNDAVAVLTCMILTLGSAATAPGYRPLVILVVFLATACWVMPVIVRRERPGNDGMHVRVAASSRSWAWLPHLSALLLTVAGLFLGVLLYLFVPRLALPQDNQEQKSHLDIAARKASRGGSASGFAREMKLGDIGRIKRDDRVAFEAQLRYFGRPYNPPLARRTMLLLRARAWDRYLPAEQKWERRLGKLRWLTSDGVLERGDTPVDWDMHTHGYSGSTLFLPQRARRIRSSGVRLARDPADSIVASKTLRRYGVEGGDPVTSMVDVRRLIADRRKAEHLDVPVELSDVLARHLPAHKGLSVSEKIRAIGQFFTQGQFRYTLDLPPSLPEGMDPIEAFLERREGHCELFASAACLMLRMMAVPARMAGGVRLAERIGPGRYRARYRNAHAWVEVPFHVAGFVAFDFTPPDRRAVTPSAELGSNDENEATLGIDQRRQQETAGAEEVRFDWSDPLRFTREDQARMRRQVGDALSAIPFVWVGIAAGCFMIVVLLRGWRRRVKRDPLRVHAPDGTAARTLAFYVKWLKRCAAAGHRRRANQTPREFLASLPEPLRDAGREITARFEALRYG
ncbi:MAG: transglutaminase TgpA family protein [Planctomycetota bacterium]|jgi:hypothetical protein